MNKPIRVLHIWGSMNQGGVESFIINLYRNIDREKIQFDFYLNDQGQGFYENEIKRLGGEIFKPVQRRNYWYDYICSLCKLLKSERDIKVIHIHSYFFSGAIALIAKICKVPNIIIHSHTTEQKGNDNFKRKVYRNVMRRLINRYSYYKLACSESAAISLYGKSSKDDEKVKIIHNCIDLEDYDTTKYDRQETIKKYNIQTNVKKIIHIGRFVEAKNHKFLLRVIKEMKIKDHNIKLYLIGYGELEREIKQKIEDYNIQDVVSIFPASTNIPEILSVMDCMIFPSIYEGFAITLIEAQVMGVRCFVSDIDTVSKESQLGLCEYISLEKSPKEWAKIILTTLNQNVAKTVLNPKTVERFSIHNLCQEMIGVYTNEEDKKINQCK